MLLSQEGSSLTTYWWLMKLYTPCIPGKNAKKGSLALKLDISKTYDQVEWNFLQGIMVKLGFLETWINWVMGCVTTDRPKMN